jgi:small subunit ribosomal protein S6
LKTIVKKLYEGMFLVDSAEAAADWDGVETRIKNILERADAEIVSLRKWEERRLAYEIDRKIRGTYVLCYFKTDGKRIGDIERDVQLSEQIMRVLILSADHLTQEDIEKNIPVMLAEKQGQKASEAAGGQAEAAPVGAEEGSEVEAESAEVSEEAAAEVAESVEHPESDSGDLEAEEFSAKEASESSDKGDKEKSQEN